MRDSDAFFGFICLSFIWAADGSVGSMRAPSDAGSEGGEVRIVPPQPTRPSRRFHRTKKTPDRGGLFVACSAVIFLPSGPVNRSNTAAGGSGRGPRPKLNLAPCVDFSNPAGGALGLGLPRSGCSPRNSPCVCVCAFVSCCFGGCGQATVLCVAWWARGRVELPWRC